MCKRRSQIVNAASKLSLMDSVHKYAMSVMETLEKKHDPIVKVPRVVDLGVNISKYGKELFLLDYRDIDASDDTLTLHITHPEEVCTHSNA